MHQVKEIMLPLAEYAVVDEGATLTEAFAALDAAQTRLPAGRQPHRAVLVRDAAGQIVGKLGHLAFLRALLVERPATDSSLLDRAGVSDEVREASAATLRLMTADLVDVCERARHLRVGDVCAPTTAFVGEEASLVEAMKVFTEVQTLSLLVQCGRETVGILRLADLFDELARQIRLDECDNR